MSKSKSVLFFAFLTVFSLLIPNLVSSVVIIKTYTLLPSWSLLLLNITCALISCVSFYFMLFYLVRDFQLNEEERIRMDFRKGLSVISFWALALCLFAVQAKYIYPVISPILTELSFSFAQMVIGSVLYLLAGIILLILSILLLLSSILIMFKQSAHKTYSHVLKASILIFQRPLLSLTLIIGTIVSGVLAILLVYLADLALSRIAVSAFLALFLESAFLSAWTGFALSFLSALTVKSLVAKQITLDDSSEGTSSRFSLVFPVTIIILGVFLSIPARGSFDNYLLNSIDAEYRMAEKLKAEEKLDLSSYHYKRSYYLSQTALTYLKLLSADKDKSSTDSYKNELNQEFESTLRETLTVSPGIGLVYYLDALRYNLIKQPASAINSLEAARILAPEFPNSNLMLLNQYKTPKDGTKLTGLAASIINKHQFYSYSPLEKKSLSQIKKLSKKLAEKSSVSFRNFSLLAYYYYQNKLYPEAAKELELLSKKLPDDLAVNYLIAMVDLEMMQDNKQYTAALKAVEKISQLYPNEKWALDLKTQVATKAGKKDIVESALEQVYLKNPADIEIAEQYAYSIISKNTGFDFNETDQKAEIIIDKIIQQTNDSWFGFYCKSILDLKKKDFGNSLQSLNKFLTLIAKQEAFFTNFDDFYYLYTLKYKNFITYEEGKKALENIKNSDPLTYNYIWGTYYWSVKDYDNSKIFLNNTIQINPNLSKPHFVLGSVYFEQAYLKGIKENYPKAIEEYNKALNIFPEDPYTWFSLGHVYNKLERLEDALGAFQKALFYMPAEDHNFDYYGVSAHSKMQIDEINSKLQNKTN
jgi:tetratricopeptide (TPR) repeat protein